MLEKCNLCPHKCGINRNNQLGKCKASQNVKIALASLHYYEEPCISGKNGSGTIFFSHCNLKCMYCQNYKISQEGYGKYITINHLADIMLSQEKKGAHNINLVSPTIYVVQIIEAIKIAKSKGLSIPIIYNSSGYENIETINLLNGYIDVYLPDFKYYYDDLALKYSGIKNYSKIAKDAIQKMYEQVGNPIFDKYGMIKKGVIIRHLVLPGNIENSKKVLNWIKENIGANVYISLMAQYFPTYKAKEDSNINRKLNVDEYNEIQDYLFNLELENGYIQELSDSEEEYVPNFDLSE